ncbi:dienelactone hydrolase family protein [Bacillus vallismortis]|uniref:Prolyl oligopeptidase family serine peptidase n=1 Tax=Bacillus vallismortis TaxID=72361 RepID=A0ABY4XWZ0_BACVA|nr:MULTISPECIES: dienelactone hydrolase family protein [Bacillus]MBL3646068.1 dienelactone hydrolase family protein [Bacillus sp. RHFS10]MDM5302928.1 prolyl oligopeptidase family serine peptidase [Bacillus subtilis]MDM5324981.1 prolyl oligopeptidase family serine peptidase [Bacillus subtilis]USP94484.1 prolyl oligopeptidase family serine peptidase [Bacillus vallismortis]
MREERRKQLFRLLGDLPDRRQIRAETLRIEEREGNIIETLLLDLNGHEKVPAYFVKPESADGPCPSVLFQHSHGGRYDKGKSELIEGADYLKAPSFSSELTSLGYSVLAIDHWGFGDRRGKAESEIFKEMLLTGRVMWGMMIYDSLRALDYMQSRPDVQADRIGTIGMSMGGLMAWWTTALDDRIKVCVDLCSQVDHHVLMKTQNLDRHGFYYYVPSLAKYFSASEIQSLIAPRPHLSLVGAHDRLTPAEGVNKIEKELSAVYAEQGATDCYRVARSASGHFETAVMRHEAVRFLQKRL